MGWILPRTDVSFHSHGYDHALAGDLQATRAMVGKAACLLDANGIRVLQSCGRDVDHQILGIHYVNETVPPDKWIYWDLAFLVWDALMLIEDGSCGRQANGIPHQFQEQECSLHS